MISILPFLYASGIDNMVLGYGYDPVKNSVRNKFINYDALNPVVNGLNNNTYLLPSNIDLSIIDDTFTMSEYQFVENTSSFYDYHSSYSGTNILLGVINYFKDDLSIYASASFNSDINLLYIYQTSFTLYQLEYDFIEIIEQKQSPFYIDVLFMNDTELINKYGVIIPYRCSYGGLYEVITRMNIDLEAYMNVKLEATLNSLFTVMMGIIGDIGIDIEILAEIDAIFRQNATIDMIFMGGSPFNEFKTNMSDFNSSVIDNPALFTCDYKWIYDFIEDITRKNSMKNNVEIYLNNSSMNNTNSCAGLINSFSINDIVSKTENKEHKIENTENNVTYLINEYTQNIINNTNIYKINITFGNITNQNICVGMNENLILNASMIASAYGEAKAVFMPSLPLPLIGILTQNAFLQAQAEINALFDAKTQLFFGLMFDVSLFDIITFNISGDDMMRISYDVLNNENDYIEFINNYGMFYIDSFEVGIDCLIYTTIDMNITIVQPTIDIYATAELALCHFMDNIKIKLWIFCINYYINKILPPLDPKISGYIEVNMKCSNATIESNNDLINAMKNPSPINRTIHYTFITEMDDYFNNQTKNENLINTSLKMFNITNYLIY
jgi:hypothetical protein